MTAVAEPAPPALPAAPPSAVNASGRPCFGAGLGYAEVNWGRLRAPWARGPLWTRLHAKRWHYVCIAGPDVIIAFAVIDIGWAASAFAYLFDRHARRLLADLSFMGLPGLSARVATSAGPGASSSFRGPRVRLAIERPVGSPAWRAVLSAPGFTLDATLDAAAAPPALCAVARIEGGVANCTHKTMCLPTHGHAEAGGRRFDLSGATAIVDHTNGLLARETRWRWASAARGDVGLNLVAGFNGPVENALWIGGRVHAVGAAEIDPRGCVRTVDGCIDLTFTPEGERREDKNLLVAVSRYVQPIGSFTGTVRPPGGAAVAVDGLPGVTEDHEARW